MDRKWRLNRGAHETVESPIDFKRKYVDVLSEGQGEGEHKVNYEMQRLVDVYALYTVLHIEKRVWNLYWSGQHGLYYFIAEKRQDADGEGEKGEEIIQGDEGSGDESDEGAQDAGNEDGDDDGDDKEGGVRDTKETVYCDAPVVEGKDGSSVIGKQVLVPVSSGTQSLTPRVMHSFCQLGKGVAQQVLLSVVDSNGTATRCCIYDYIQVRRYMHGSALLAPRRWSMLVSAGTARPGRLACSHPQRRGAPQDGSALASMIVLTATCTLFSTGTAQYTRDGGNPGMTVQRA